MKKKLSTFLVLAVMFAFSNVIVSAHSSSQKGILMENYHTEKSKYYIGGEEVGWWLDEDNHPFTNIITYRFAPIDYYMTASDKQKVREGASRWSGTVSIYEVDTDGMGTVLTYTDANSSVVAQCANYKTDSNGHWGYFELRINKAKTQTEATYAHEFGHAIGLKDLYTSSNRNKLMYGVESRTVSNPTSIDKWGAKVITGQHTSHSWSYRYYDTVANGNRHVKYCTSCNGFAAIASCIYNANNVCKFCSVPKGATTSSIIPERE